MKTSKLPDKAIPRHDYRAALEGALSWLGNRYLLAEPVNRRSDDCKPSIAVQQRLPAHTRC